MALNNECQAMKNAYSVGRDYLFLPTVLRGMRHSQKFLSSSHHDDGRIIKPYKCDPRLCRNKRSTEEIIASERPRAGAQFHAIAQQFPFAILFRKNVQRVVAIGRTDPPALRWLGSARITSAGKIPARPGLVCGTRGHAEG